LKEAINAINRYYKIKGFNKFILNKDTWYLNGFEQYYKIKKDKYTKIYAEISIYGKTDTLIDDLNSITSITPTKTGKIGDILKSRRVRTENLLEFQTKNLQTVVYTNIYFVLDVGENGVCLDIDEKLMNLAL
jgi:hypothetical protein